jgi:hypothetical protein
MYLCWRQLLIEVGVDLFSDATCYVKKSGLEVAVKGLLAIFHNNTYSLPVSFSHGMCFGPRQGAVQGDCWRMHNRNRRVLCGVCCVHGLWSHVPLGLHHPNGTEAAEYVNVLIPHIFMH